MSEEIKIITLGDIFKNIETEEKAFKFKDYIRDLQQKVEQLEKENKELNRMCELYGQSLYNADLTKAEKKVEQLEKEIDRLNKEYERIYNENCKLRENHNINDITLLDENERLNRIIDNIFKFMQNKYDNSDLTGFTISFMELQDLKELKETNNV